VKIRVLSEELGTASANWLVFCRAWMLCFSKKSDRSLPVKSWGAKKAFSVRTELPVLRYCSADPLLDLALG
jgi:hypothetical protein